MKSFGWAVVTKDGSKESDLYMDEPGAEKFAHVLNSLEGPWAARGPFQVVELFYNEVKKS